MHPKITEKIDTETYNRIRKTLPMLSYGAFILGELLINKNIDFAFANMVLSLVGFCGSFSLVLNNNKELTTDASEVVPLYKEFIKKYNNEINKTFDLKDPYEIYALYYYLYKNGYLSINKDFKYDVDAKSNDIASLMGCNVLSGSGVCRHISGLLSDIMCDYGMDAINMSVYGSNYFIVFDTFTLFGKNKEELKKWMEEYVVDKESYYSALLEIDKLEKRAKPIILTDPHLHLATRIGGNHAITYVNYNGRNYYLDPTNKTSYRMSPKDKCLYNDTDRLKIKQVGARLIASDKKKYKELYDKAKEWTPCISVSQEENIMNRMYWLFRNNMDIINKFYFDNRDLKEEIAYKSLKLK